MKIPLWTTKMMTGERIRRYLWLICERIPQLRYGWKFRIGIQ